MNAPEPDPRRDGATEREREADERCLATLMLLHDGQPVDAELAAWARAHVAQHAHCAAAYAELLENAATLAATPALRARPDFTARVLAELSAGAAGPTARADVLPFVRRLAVAAGLALAVTLFVEMAQPSPVQADAALQRQRHAADHFRRGAFGPQDIEAGLRGRLADPAFGSQSPATELR